MLVWHGPARRFVETTARRISPLGLRASGHHRAVWMVKGLTYCPDTFEELTSRCPGCDGKLQWETARALSRCESCWTVLADYPGGRLSADLHADAKDVAGLVSPDSQVRNQVLRSLPQPFCSWEPGDVFQAAVELGLITSSPIAPPNCPRSKLLSVGDFSRFSAAELVSGYNFIKSWPRSFRRHVEEVTRERRGDRRTFLGRMGKYFDRLAPETPLCRLIRQELPAVLGELNVSTCGRRSDDADRSRRDGTITSNDALTHFGMLPTKLGSAERQPSLPDLATTGSKWSYSLPS